MNAKLLYAATVAVAVFSTYAVADESRPLTRADVIADYQQAAANGTLRKNDYDYDAHDFDAVSVKNRAQVLAELDASRRDRARLVGPDRNRTYNQFGTEVLRQSTLARGEVKGEVLAARRDGTLRRTDYDDEQIHLTRRNGDPIASPVLAGRSVGRGS
jgi:hypothetical protein